MKLLMLVLGDSPDGSKYACVNLGDTEDGAQLRARMARAERAFDEVDAQDDELAAFEFFDGATLFLADGFEPEEVLTSEQCAQLDANDYAVLSEDDLDALAYDDVPTVDDAVRIIRGPQLRDGGQSRPPLLVSWRALAKHDEAMLRTVNIAWPVLEPLLK